MPPPGTEGETTPAEGVVGDEGDTTPARVHETIFLLLLRAVCFYLCYSYHMKNLKATPPY